MSERSPASEAPQYDLEIVLSSGESWTKAHGTIERIASELEPNVLLTVFCGEEDTRSFPARKGVRLLVRPGCSVFHLRAALPEILVGSRWVAIVEDHALPEAGWVKALLEASADVGPDVMAFTGTATNGRSTAPWDWANFLFNFAYHWYPSKSTPLRGTVTTSVFRPELLGTAALGFYDFEHRVLGCVGPLFNSLRVDHAQKTPFWIATTHSFDNGLVTGDGLRRNSPRPWRGLLSAVRNVHGRRMRELAEVIAAHPLRQTLPGGIMLRLRWIGLCHSAGMAIGTVFGAGNAAHRLE